MLQSINWPLTEKLKDHTTMLNLELKPLSPKLLIQLPVFISCTEYNKLSQKKKTAHSMMVTYGIILLNFPH